MMHSILVPLDGSKLSEEVLPFAAAIGTRLGAELTLLYVVSPEGFSERVDERYGHLLDGFAEYSRQWAEGYLSGVQERLREQGTESTPRVATGGPAQAIVSEARRPGIGLIAMTTHGRSGLARWTMGSVAEGVLRETTAPLLLYRATGQGGTSTLGKVMLPLGGSPASEQAIPLATSLTRKLAVPLVLARAVPMTVFGADDDGADYMVEVLEAMEEEAQGYLEQKQKDLVSNGLVVESRFLRGDAASSLIDLTHKLPDCLVVMSTAGRTGLGRMILGSVADRVVRHSARPVVLVRAAD